MLHVAAHFFALDLERFLRHVHQVVETFEEVRLVLRLVREAGHIDGDDADRSGKRVRAEKSAAAAAELAVVETETAAHRTRVLGFHV